VVVGLALLGSACGGGGGSDAKPTAAAGPVASTTVPAGVPTGIARVDACALLTTAEVKAGIGSTPVADGAPLVPTLIQICRWKLTADGARAFAIAVNPEAAVSAASAADPDEAPTVKPTPVAGLGDKAEFVLGKDRASLSVHVGDSVLSMACVCAPTMPTQAQLVGLAKTALSRLP
jgi:hypothetical protein